jgi:hypothetical protein
MLLTFQSRCSQGCQGRSEAKPRVAAGPLLPEHYVHILSNEVRRRRTLFAGFVWWRLPGWVSAKLRCWGSLLRRFKSWFRIRAKKKVPQDSPEARSHYLVVRYWINSCTMTTKIISALSIHHHFCGGNAFQSAQRKADVRDFPRACYCGYPFGTRFGLPRQGRT